MWLMGTGPPLAGTFSQRTKRTRACRRPDFVSRSVLEQIHAAKGGHTEQAHSAWWSPVTQPIIFPYPGCKGGPGRVASLAPAPAERHRISRGPRQQHACMHSWGTPWPFQGRSVEQLPHTVARTCTSRRELGSLIRPWHFGGWRLTLRAACHARPRGHRHTHSHSLHKTGRSGRTEPRQGDLRWCRTRSRTRWGFARRRPQ